MYRPLNFFVLFIFSFGIKAQEDQLITYDAVTFKISGGQLNENSVDLNELKDINGSQNRQMPPPDKFYSIQASRFSDIRASNGMMNNEDYPASAAVKIVSIHGDTTWDKCSGMIVGDRYVLTAGHCVVNEVDEWKGTRAFVPYLYVKPAFDKGMESKFGRVKVKRIYVYKSYFLSNSKKDVALLELEDPVGENTGWVNMDYQEDDQQVKNMRFYNFSYPMDGARVNYDRDFNGDTLYLKTGYPDLVSENYIGIKSVGIPGESGSLLIADDRKGYTAYAVRNFSEMKFSFYRLKKEEVFAFYNLMYRNDVAKTQEQSVSCNSVARGISISPNPVFEKAVITAGQGIDQIELICLDAKGSEVFRSIINGVNGKFVFENYNLPQGRYFLIAEQNNLYIGTAKVVIRK